MDGVEEVGVKRDCQCPRANHVHGTVEAYGQDGCRCPDCRQAQAASLRRYRRQKAYGRWPDQWDTMHGTLRRLEGLTWMGYTAAELASRLDVNERWVRRMLKRSPDHVIRAATREKVKALYDDLMTRPAPSGRYAKFSRRRAEQLGWPSPWVWDDIDDPAEKPKGMRRAA